MVTRVSNWDKFSLLLWKNWTLQWTHKVQLLVELLLPGAFILLLVILRSEIIPTPREGIEYQPLNITTLRLFKDTIALSSRMQTFITAFLGSQSDSLPKQKRNIQVKYDLYYAPENPVLASIMQEAVEALEMRGYKGYASAKALESAVLNDNVFAGIEFPAEWSTITELPTKFRFALRFPAETRTVEFAIGYTWKTPQKFLYISEQGPRNEEADDGGLPVGYLREGFLPIQNAISRAYIRQKSKDKAELPDVVMQRYPYPDYLEDELLDALNSVLAFLTLISFTYPCAITTKQITVEKEQQLKEVMKIMGLQNWIHWAAWFTKTFMMLALSALLICTLLTTSLFNEYPVLIHSSFASIFVYLIIFVINVICFSFMLSTFFSRANSAASISGLLFWITYLPYTLTNPNYGSMSRSIKLFYCLFPSTAMGYGFNIIASLEITGEGLHLGNLFSPISIDDNLDVGSVLLVMLFSTASFMLICLYVEQIAPGEFGVPKKWNYPFSYDYWFGDREYIGIEDIPNGHVERPNPHAFELEPAGRRAGIQVRNLRKKFGTKEAVKGISVNMYEDEITVLLGHNGAGKTTTISMLTGMFPPTSGTASIHGADIRTNIEGARASMGICPQHNVLFDDMSVANHIVFFSRLKGVKGKDIDAEIHKYLKIIELEDKADVASKNLSGGMKRKLSVCSALCGDTKVVLCDEPSSGMDPSARRQLWDLLQAEKTGRTILLTTHFMDEADVLGDRIAIMSEGELKCHGTPFFLKKKFSSGYNLICVKREYCNVTEVTTLLNRYIPALQPESDVGAELTYQLPDNYAHTFEEMFVELEEHSQQLGLTGYGISNASLEDVFMKVGVEAITMPSATTNEHSETRKDTPLQVLNGRSEAYLDDVDVECINSDRMFSTGTRMLRGSALIVNQFYAMLLKKMLHTWRNKLLMVIQIIVPMYYIITSVIASRTFGLFQRQIPLTISPLNYRAAVLVMENATNSAYATASASGTLMARIADQYKSVALSYGKNYEYASTGDETFSEYIVRLGESKQVIINARYVAAATIADDGITAWLNNQPLHTAPLTVNMVNNAIAKALIGPYAEISVTNYPLPLSTETVINGLSLSAGLGSALAINICFSMCFVTSFYILFVIKERMCRAKLMQFVGGVHVWIFWLSHYIWDLVTLLITMVITLATLACFQEQGFSKFSELALYFLLLAIFAVSVLPFTYVMSTLFTEPASGFARISILNAFVGLALFLIVIALELVTAAVNFTKWLQLLCPLFPHFSLAMSFFKLSKIITARSACARLPAMPPEILCQLVSKCCEPTSYFSWGNPGVLKEIVYMLGTGTFCMLALIVFEYGIFNDALHAIHQLIIRQPIPPEYENIDNDVLQEREHVRTMVDDQQELAHQNLVLDRVTKYYGRFYSRFLAVNQLSLCVKAKECFGLLGVNGAGKTTTFKMMTGDEHISTGKAYMNGVRLDGSLRSICQNIGYCPQFDALLDELTGREWLKIFCLLRGIPEHRIGFITDELAKSFGFVQHLDKPVQAYSGGNKRKLSTSLAVVGGPSLVYLDEPTTGMDPAARRQLWNVVCRIRDAGKSIILTSHSMEECEALCTRLAIMVNGEFKCIGSSQHLKNKFSKGFIMKLKVKRQEQPHRHTSTSSDAPQQNVDALKDFIEDHLQQSVLKDECQGILTYYIPFSGVKWSTIFGLIERHRSALCIEDYTISQTTLEEIFLEFAKHQRDDPRQQV